MSNRRLTQPMRQVLQNLIDGKPIGYAPNTDRVAWDTSVTAATSLRKRGYVTLGADATYTITPHGREALAQHGRSIN